MADDVVRTITIRGKNDGVDDLAGSLKKLADAQGAVATVSDTSTKSSLSIQQAYDRQTQRVDLAARMATQYAQAEKVALAAKDAGIINSAEYAARIDLLSQKYSQASTLSKAFGQATSGLLAPMIALSAGAGPVGIFLSALGPWGIAASVGLGAVSAAIHYVAEESARMGQKAIDMRAFLDVTGLTVGQIGALRDVGSSLGIAGEQIATSVERMTGSLADARRASGTLYDEVRLVSGGLADQLRQTTTTAGAIDVLANAWRRAGDESTKAQIAKAAFGQRGGAALGPALGQIADAGGLQAIVDKMGQFNDATDAQTKRWAQMQAQIDATNSRAKNILASIFTEAGLTAALAAAQALERAAKAAKDIADQRDGLTFMQRLKVGAFEQSFDKSEGMGALNVSPDDQAQVAMMAARLRLTNQMNQGMGVKPEDIESWNKLVDTFHSVTTAAVPVVSSMKQMQDAAAAASKAQSELVSFLGAGATIDEKLAARLATINSLYLDNKTGATGAAQAIELKNRAEAAANLDAVIQKESLRIGLLGNLASVAEIVKAKQDAINRANQEGAKISDDLAAKIKFASDVQAQASKLQTQAQFGIFDPAAQIANAKRELENLFNDPSIQQSAENYANAWAVITKRLKDASDQAAVARSVLPQLTQAGLDAGNIAKQFDTFATSSLNNFSTALVDVATGAATAGDAFRNFGMQVVRALDDAIIKLILIKPLIDAMQASLGGGGIFSFLGIGGGGGAKGIGDVASLGEKGFGVDVAHTGGIVGSTAFASAYIHPAYYENAQKFATGGIAGIGPDEVPILAHRNEEIIRADDPRHRWNGGASSGDTTLKQEITFNVVGAMGKSEIKMMINQGMAAATQQAVSIVTAGAPARQSRLQKLGT